MSAAARPPQPGRGNLLTREPVAAAAVLAPIVVYLAAAFGFDVDEGTAAAIAGAALVIGGYVARRLVTPAARPRAADGTPLVPFAPGGPLPGSQPGR
jgi:hypothetical protein